MIELQNDFFDYEMKEKIFTSINKASSYFEGSLSKFYIYLKDVNFIEQNTSPQKVTFLIFKIKNRIKRFLPKIIINRFAKLEDKLGERELSAPLLQELINKKYYKNGYLC
mgnify:CR=1 FL=1